jgi:hypothetical protein
MLSRRLNRYYEPLRLPSTAVALSFPYTLRSVASPPPPTGLQHWAINLRKHADPATPGVSAHHFRCFSAHPTAFPFCSQGRRIHFVYEATHRFTCVTACSLAVWKLTPPCCHDAASSCYRGVRTTPRTGLKPARLTAVTANGQTTVINKWKGSDEPIFDDEGDKPWSVPYYVITYYAYYAYYVR